MTLNKHERVEERPIDTDSQPPANTGRRDVLRKLVYVPPALLVLGSLHAPTIKAQPTDPSPGSATTDFRPSRRRNKRPGLPRV